MIKWIIEIYTFSGLNDLGQKGSADKKSLKIPWSAVMTFLAALKNSSRCHYQPKILVFRYCNKAWMAAEKTGK